MVNRRNSYTTKQKLEITKFAEENNNNSEAARKFNVTESTIRKCIKNKRVFNEIKPKEKSIEKWQTKMARIRKES